MDVSILLAILQRGSMRKIFILSFIVLILCGCTQNQVDDLKKSVASLKSQNADLQNEINQLNMRLFFLQNSYAAFTPSSKGYSTLKANVGTFIVALKKITPYANGYQATFTIGNPSLMTFDGAVATLEWGQPYQKGENYLEWLNSLKSEQIKIEKPILPGVWNVVTFVLSPATAEDTGFISLALQTDQIFLYQDHRKHG